ncbi:MAG TPA: response regulator [Candidatus Thermoplasmatota archaeon]
MIRVLVVDDEADIAATTVEMLELRGYNAASVTDVMGIADAIKRHQPDLILQDAQMPGLDLKPAIIAARGASRKRVVILIFTASVDAERIWRIVGADGFVEKPFKFDALQKEIERRTSVRAMHS